MDVDGALRLPERPDAVLLDLFHTLVVLRPGGDLGPPVHEALGVDRDAWRAAFFADQAGRLLGGISDPVEALRVVVRDVDPDVPEERIRKAARDRARRLEDALVHVDAGVLDALARLRSAGIRCVLVSNAGSDEILAWPRSPLAPLMDAVVFSCDVGIAKPDAGIYLHALEAAGADAARCLFAGDGGSDELRGARAVGLRTVLVSGHARRLWPERLAQARSHADHEVDDVAGIADALGL